MKNDTRNTMNDLSNGSGLLLLAEAMSGGRQIERMEAQGQRELTRSDVLPTEGTEDDKRWASIGVMLGDKVPGDEIFRYATLPDGWHKRATDHSMWSDLVDDKGRVRATIFYKAAFYDRSAHVGLSRRFRVDAVTESGEHDYKAPHFGRVLDGGTEVYRTALTTEGDRTTDQYGYQCSHGEAARTMAARWLDANYPDWKSTAAYWD